MTASRAVLVVPCYNEARRLDLDGYHRFLRAQDRVDVLFVNDGSRDATLQVLESVRSEHERRVTVVDLAANRGKAEAVRQGVLRALAGSWDYVGYWDADLATALEVSTEWIDFLDQRNDMHWVYGSRIRLLGRSIDRRLTRHLSGRVFATVASIALDLPVYDTQCGAKLFRRGDQAIAVFTEPFVSRWVFDVEILARILVEHRQTGANAEFPVCEIPLHAWRDVGDSTLTFAQSLRAVLDLARIGIRLRSATPKRIIVKPAVAPTHPQGHS